MNFLYLEESHKKWRDILVFGKTVERDNKKCHIIGMTLEDNAKIYILEPYNEPKHLKIKTHRRMLKEHRETGSCHFDCREFRIGNRKLKVNGGSSGSLGNCLPESENMQLFFDMMSAGWVVPEWLKDIEWDNLCLTTLDISDIKRLPKYSAGTPIIISHKPDPICHIIEKTVTLNVGKSCSFSFIDNYGDKVQCYINNVSLIDVWQTIEKSFNDPRYLKRYSQEELKEIKRQCCEGLEDSCAKGECDIGIEYECSKDINLQFYSKEYLNSSPETHKGGRCSRILMRFKPDKKIGTHNLAAKGCALQTKVPPDTSKIITELFCYFEHVDMWEEKL